ncbi:hypothetical protein CLV59_108145 [Chitinophaga dinghuensis]|uniref:Glycosyl transferase family 25 n=1 Tax=Chitinophaga dinghuensis TaxID=1539050 RepID=A0A327VQA2_9BACT|nr:hypothetical protein [Chitinophaga dinghuensis]RAJ76626.1 hypothetical protein CLV59_108145 [Chitinophaga dinghuensis]
MLSIPIPTFIINLKHRSDRRTAVTKAFQNRNEFAVQIVEAKEHKIGAVGLWESIQHILEHLVTDKDDFILICEDDHQFTTAYTADILQNSIKLAKEKEADILLGGVSWCNAAVPVTDHLFWVNKFSGLQFAIIFRKFFDVLRSLSFQEQDAADYKIAAITEKKFVIYPFISIQKGYDYSDVTAKNNQVGRVEELFASSLASLEAILKVKQYYGQQSDHEIPTDTEFETITLPTYVINLPERVERLAHIKQQFEGRMEFDLNIIEACKQEVGALGLWMSIRKIVAMAKEREEDVIVISEDDHEFTADYSRDVFLKNVLQSFYQNADYISGGTGGASLGIMIDEGRFWASRLLSTQFIVIYSKFFDAILEEPFDETVLADIKLSEMTSNKMVLYPFISVQKDFGYSDITAVHNEHKGIVQNLFAAASQQLGMIKRIQQTQLL